MLSYEIDIALRDRTLTLGQLIRKGAPLTDAQRKQMAMMADRATLPKKRGRPRGSALTPKQKVERLVIRLVQGSRSKYRTAGTDLPRGMLDQMIEDALELVGNDGELHGLEITNEQAKFMRENIRSALTHGKRDKVGTK